MNDAEVQAWQKACLAENLIKKMAKRGIKAFYAPTAEEAKEVVLGLIPQQGSLALLGSQTMNQIGVFSHLRSSQRELVDHASLPKNLSSEEVHDYKRRAFFTEAMLAGTNAIDADGRLYNIDGLGNRVAPMIFGPKKVILAASLNKVAPTADEAWRRARQTAAPLNNKRLGLPNPCTKSGHCHDCQLESSICSYFTIIDRSRPLGRINMVLIGQDLGY